MRRPAFFLGLGCGALVVLAAAGLLVVGHAGKPPDEAELLRNFAAHRAAFEQLKEMLQADRHLRRVAGWGVETTEPVFLGNPQGHFPLDRYNRYLDLLQEAGGIGAARGEGEQAAVAVVVWAGGFAGGTTHVGVSCEEEEPAHQVAHLNDRDPSREPGPGWHRKCRRIEGNWYLWTDL